MIGLTGASPAACIGATQDGLSVYHEGHWLPQGLKALGARARAEASPARTGDRPSRLSPTAPPFFPAAPPSRSAKDRGEAAPPATRPRMTPATKTLPLNTPMTKTPATRTLPLESSPSTSPQSSWSSLLSSSPQAAGQPLDPRFKLRQLTCANMPSREQSTPSGAAGSTRRTLRWIGRWSEGATAIMLPPTAGEARKMKQRSKGPRVTNAPVPVFNQPFASLADQQSRWVATAATPLATATTPTATAATATTLAERYAALASCPKLVVRQERKGHGGKSVTLLEGIDDAEIAQFWARHLGRARGCGSRAEGGTVVLQGQHAEDLQALLLAQGVTRLVRG